MIILKMLIKIVLFPLLIVIMIAQWLCIFLNIISGVITQILSGLFCFTGIVSYLFGLSSGKEAVSMLAVGFVLFLIPHIGNWIILRIIEIRFIIGDYIGS